MQPLELSPSAYDMLPDELKRVAVVKKAKHMSDTELNELMRLHNLNRAGIATEEDKKRLRLLRCRYEQKEGEVAVLMREEEVANLVSLSARFPVSLERMAREFEELRGIHKRAMTGAEFRNLLDLIMCSDPWPVPDTGDGDGQDNLIRLADRESKARGFADWIEAYHRYPHSYTKADLYEDSRL